MTVLENRFSYFTLINGKPHKTASTKLCVVVMVTDLNETNLLTSKEQVYQARRTLG